MSRIIVQLGSTYSGAPNNTLEPTRAGDVRHSLADIARARELLGYEPVVSFEEGLEGTLEWMKTQSA